MDKIHTDCECTHCKLVNDLNKPLGEQDPFVQLWCALQNCKEYMAFMHESDVPGGACNDVADYINYSCNMCVMEHSIDVLRSIMQSLELTGETLVPMDDDPDAEHETVPETTGAKKLLN